MKKLLSFMALSTMFLASTLFAAQQSATVKRLGAGAWVKPQINYPLSLADLNPGDSYTVECIIFAPQVEKRSRVQLGPGGIQFFLNSHRVANDQGTLDKRENHYKAINVYKKTGALTFRNVSRQEFWVGNCSATRTR